MVHADDTPVAARRSAATLPDPDRHGTEIVRLRPIHRATAPGAVITARRAYAFARPPSRRGANRTVWPTAGEA